MRPGWLNRLSFILHIAFCGEYGSRTPGCQARETGAGDVRRHLAIDQLDRGDLVGTIQFLGSGERAGLILSEDGRERVSIF